MSISNKIKGLRAMSYFDNCLQIIMSRLLFRNTSLVVYKKRDCEILVDQNAGDVNGIRTVLTSKMYSQFLPELAHFRNERLNVFDLGAHVGGFPLLLHIHGFTIGRLCSVELNPATYSRMRFNIASNLPCEFIPIQGAVCRERRQLMLYLGKGSVSDNIYSTESNNRDQVCGLPVRVEGWTFDELYQQAFPNNEIIDVCKIDVEGAEFDIFLSSSHEAIRRVTYLFMEIHPQENRDSSIVIDRLSECGLVLIAKDTLENVFFFRNKSLARAS